MTSNLSSTCPKSVLPVEGGMAGDECTPFIHRFQTERVTYIYDVNTLRILRVSPVVWDIICDYGLLSESKIIKKFRSTYEPEQIKDAFRKITQIREENGLLLSNRPHTILPPKKEMIQSKLDAYRHQLILNVTDTCNFRCSYCVFGGEYKEYRCHSESNMPWDIARQALDDFFRHSHKVDVRSISFYGGEPLLNLKLIRQCVRYVRDTYDPSNVSFSMTTNGALLQDGAAEFLAKENFSILVSLDGPREIHDKNRRTKSGDPTWENVTSNVRRFLETYPQYQANSKLRFNAVATQATDLCQCQSFWIQSAVIPGDLELSVSLKKHQNIKYDQSDTPLRCSHTSLYKQFIENLRSGLINNDFNHISTRIQRALFERPFFLFHRRKGFSGKFPQQMRFLNHCIPGERRTFVNTRGDYFPCERVPTGERYCIGHVETGMQVEMVMDMLHDWVQGNNENCRDCWCLPTCTMGCVASIPSQNNLLEIEKRNACSNYRKNMHAMIVDYCQVLEENPNAFDYMDEFEFE